MVTTYAVLRRRGYHESTRVRICRNSSRLPSAASPAGAVLLTFGTDGTPTNTAPNGGSLPPAVDTITKTVTSSSFPNRVTITENVYAGTTTDGIKGLLFTYQFTNAVGNAAIEAVAPGAFPAWLGTIFADYTSSSTGTQAPNDIFWNTDGGVDFSGGGFNYPVHN